MGHVLHSHGVVYDKRCEETGSNTCQIKCSFRSKCYSVQFRSLLLLAIQKTDAIPLQAGSKTSKDVVNDAPETSKSGFEGVSVLLLDDMSA